MLGVALLERCGTSFDSLDVAKHLARLPAARPDLHRRARRGAEPARGVPPTRDRDAPEPVPRVDRRAAAGGRLRLGRRRRSRGRGADGVGGRARQPRRERRLRGDVHGRRARGVALRVVFGRMRRRRALRCARRTAGSPRRCGRRATSRASASGRRSWTSSTRATAHYHWVHAINNTALVAAALYAFDGDFSGGDLRASSRAGWDTDTNGAAVGSILGALVGPRRHRRERWTAPLDGRFASSLPGFDGITMDELVRANARRRRRHRRRMTIAVEQAARPVVAEADRPADGRFRSTGPLDALDSGEDLRRPGRSRPSGRRGAGACAAGATRRPRGSSTTAAPTSSRSSPGRDAASRSRSSGSGTSCSTTTTPGASRRSGSATRRSESSEASTASCSGMRIR